MSLGAQIATIPFLVEFNSEIGLFFITANIIVIFALPFVYMAGLLALISNIKIFAYICEVILHFIISSSDLFANF